MGASAPFLFMEGHMNRHWMNGFQTNMKNDLYMVEEQLQHYDPTLYLMYNPQTGQHLIMDGILEIAIMSIPQIGFEVLDSRVVEHIKKIHTGRGFNASYEFKEAEERRDREFQKAQEDLTYNFAKDTEKHVRKLAYYGA
jgi:hypothetical protein